MGATRGAREGRLRVQHTSLSRTLNPKRTCGRVKAGVHCCPQWVSSLKHATAIRVNAMG